MTAIQNGPTASDQETATCTTTAVKPRIWPSIMAMPTALVAAVTFSGIVSTAAVIFFPGNHFAVRADGTSTAPLMILSIVAMQVGMLLCVFSFACRSNEPISRRLSAARPNMRSKDLAVVVMATLGIASMSSLLLANTTDELSPHLVSLTEFIGAQRGLALVCTVLSVGLLPGLCEELLFRGYIQTRLVKRLGPLSGIILAASLFAIMHIDPQHMVVAFILGLWCGVVVWRTGSVWSGVACHALNNTWGVLATVLLPMSVGASESDGFNPWIAAVQSVLLLILVFAIVILVRSGLSKTLTTSPTSLATV